MRRRSSIMQECVAERDRYSEGDKSSSSSSSLSLPLPSSLSLSPLCTLIACVEETDKPRPSVTPMKVPNTANSNSSSNNNLCFNGYWPYERKQWTAGRMYTYCSRRLEHQRQSQPTNGTPSSAQLGTAPKPATALLNGSSSLAAGFYLWYSKIRR